MLTFIYGTRPEALKLWPVLREAKRRKVPFRTICTGQHVDLLAGTMVRPTVHLGVQSLGDPVEYVERCLPILTESQRGKRLGTVVVQGDTASALVGARFAAQEHLPLAHIEAGLRSHDPNDPWPEEGFRVEIDRLATYRFCPTGGNLYNLAYVNGVINPDWGVPKSQVVRQTHVTGNTIVDALRLMRVARETPKGFVLVTLHRRESFGEPLATILRGLRNFAASHPDTAILWPLHPNPNVLESLQRVPMPPNVLMRGPIPYKGFVQLLAAANCVLTDSGGVVEEAATLGVPIVCARNKTERPEAFELPGNVLVGTDSELAIEGNLRLKYHDHDLCRPSTVFGDGFASGRILEVLG